MTRLADIPEDVWAAAHSAVDAMPKRSPFKMDVELAIARAIFTERQRCADAADRRGRELREPAIGGDIASAILAGAPHAH